jgi:Alr-MurF fusion protein
MMSRFQFTKIADLLNAKVLRVHHPDQEIGTLGFDTRTLVSPASALFFAIRTKNNDGHNFLADAYDKGVRNFVIEDDAALKHFPSGTDINVMRVENSIESLQLLAASHRDEFSIPVVGITGSNGKTIVKEWLFQLLNPDFNIVRSPRSYNSQIGVPLSVWLIEPDNNFAIIEAGISQPGEMEKLAKIIQPTIGIFTNIGEAHQAQFESMEQKAEEKIKLFKKVDLLIYCRDHDVIHTLIRQKIDQGYFDPGMMVIDWSMHHADAAVYIEKGPRVNNQTELVIYYEGEQYRIYAGFRDAASLENLMHCISLMLHLGYSAHTIQQRVDKLHPVEMRLEIKSGINGCTIINDSYNSDLTSLSIAIDTLNTQNQHDHKRLILSDIFESGRPAPVLYARVAEMLDQKNIDGFIGIGPTLSAHCGLFGRDALFFESTESFLNEFDFGSLKNEAILLKGSRVFGFEAIARRLQQKTHQTVLEINLSALTSNLNVYRSLLKPSTRVMAMVKAFSYGSGSYEIANILQFHKVDYLAVAYADEGVSLREQGIRMPIMIMNPEESAFEQMIRYKLEPEIYSIKLLDAFMDAVNTWYPDPFPLSIHIKLDTGMHRLGFEEEDIDLLLEKLHSNRKLHVQSIFSHLASADITGHDEFTANQAEKFDRISGRMIEKLGYPVLRHLLNSPGIARFPRYQYDMVRLGIGLYGIDPTASVQTRLEQVSTLKTHISQVRNVKKGESVGYSRKAIMEKDSVIATIGIGYADGFPRGLGNKKFTVQVNGSEAPVIGNVCMDMSMIDITNIPAREGDEVLIFGQGKSIEQMAEALGTIPYEILTSVSQRVKRVYYKD